MPRKDDIQGLLSERFQNFEAEPQIDLWKGIEAELYPEKNKNRKLWPYFSVAASITILIFAWFYLSTPAETELDPGSGFAEEQISTPIEREDPATKGETGIITNEVVPQLAEEKITPNTIKQENQDQLIEVKEASPAYKVDYKPQPLLKKQEIMDKNLASSDVLPQEEKIEVKESQIALDIAPIEKEFIAMSTADVRQPEVSKIPVSRAFDSPAEESEVNTDRSLNLKDLSFNKIVSLASNGIDKIKNASPVKVYEEKTEKGESKVYELNLFKFSVSHKTQKRRNKKVRL
ncbi:MAG: hypothetical protein R8P61_27385 [Bacteroidia bacterium]|nr:hypothetical protein [Bacteroidia bacterium]